jgi:predicted O-methyltransferase YrrM
MNLVTIAEHPMKTLLDTPISYLVTPNISLRLKEGAKRLTSVEETVDFAFSFNCLGFSLKLHQVKEDILGFLSIVDNLNPEIVLEIGTFAGGTLFLLSRFSSPTATVFSIDLPRLMTCWRPMVYKSFARDHQRIHVIRSDSHDARTLARIKKTLNGRNVDCLFIDGDHTYQGVRKDFDMYAPLVRKGGIVSFHDIVPGPVTHVGGVPEFWSEIKSRYPWTEFVKDWSQQGCGIGMIRV